MFDSLIDSPNDGQGGAKMNRFSDPEMSYRRGYEHGAWEIFNAIEHLLPASAREDARTWIRQEVRHWRAENIAGRTGRQEGATEATTDIFPPPLNLR